MYKNQTQPETMQRRYEYLPNEIKELFEYETVSIVIKNISQEFKLNEEQINTLRMEIELTLYLFLSYKDFENRITESLSIEPDIATEINKKLSEELFNIVDEILIISDKEIKKDSTSSVEGQEEKSDSETEDLEKVTPIATTEDPGPKMVHGYGAYRQEEPEEGESAYTPSSQDDLLTKKNLTEIPKYEQKDSEPT